jgi:2-keto-4-pentenoate hydratase
MAQHLAPAAAVALIDAMSVSIEIVDSRWAQAREAPALHKLADLQSHGALVLGDWQPMRAVDWASQPCELQIGTQRQFFTGTHSLGDPTWLLPDWLRHATREGAVLPAGTVVTTGTWCGLPLAQTGDAVRAIFEGIGEARVQL